MEERFDQAAQAIGLQTEFRQARCHWKFDGKGSVLLIMSRRDLSFNDLLMGTICV
jgi:hypothetical protein